MAAFDHNVYRLSVADYQENWTVMDEALYRLCRENPGHARKPSVCAKLWIIGRTYATGIERKVAASGTQGSSMSQVAELFLQNATRIDSWLGELDSISEPLTAAKLKIIVSIHGRLVRLLSEITRRNQSTRSFVSKYLHFHNRAVPIYDSVAVSTLRSVVRWRADLAIFEIPNGADKEYGWFTMRFFDLYEKAREAGFVPTVRHVDYYLLTLAQSSYTQSASKPTPPIPSAAF